MEASLFMQKNILFQRNIVFSTICPVFLILYKKKEEN